jgi:hypothetical protein
VAVVYLEEANRVNPFLGSLMATVSVRGTGRYAARRLPLFCVPLMRMLHSLSTMLSVCGIIPSVEVHPSASGDPMRQRRQLTDTPADGGDGLERRPHEIAWLRREGRVRAMSLRVSFES